MSSNTKESLSLNVKFKISDVWRYNIYIAYKNTLSRVMLIAGLGLIVGLIYKGITRTVTFDIFLSHNIIYITLAILLVVTKPWRVWTITATQMQSPIFSGITQYVFTTESISMKVSDLEDTVPWTTYQSIVETNHDFRLFVDRVQAQIIPKHNMTREQIQSLRGIIQAANPKEVYKIKKV